jgi:hypothetical protein
MNENAMYFQHQNYSNGDGVISLQSLNAGGS